VKHPICMILIQHIPDRLLDEPERFALAFVFTIIGVDALFFGAPHSVLGAIPEAQLLNHEIGFCLTVGGIFKLVGLWMEHVWIQRLGAALLILGCVGTVIGLVLYGDKADVPLGIIFGLFAIVYLLRLLSSTRERLRLQGRLKLRRHE
jgi:hypothetical protein